MSRVLFSGYSNPMRVVDGADFDFTNDFLRREGQLTGLADSKSGIFSCWVRTDTDGVSQFLLATGGLATARLSVIKAGTNLFIITAANDIGNPILSLRTTTSYTAGATWRHLLASWKLDVALARRFYVNDVDDTNAPTFTDGTIDYTDDASGGSWGVGANWVSGASKFDGGMAELYFAPGQYLDFSLVANRRKFISASGKPVHLGSDGSLPTGIAPIIYLHLDDAETADNFATNRGTGGGFTNQSTLVTTSTSPSD